MAEDWYYATNGQQVGPVSSAALRELAAQGGLQPSDMVWTEGMSAWAPAGATRGLFPGKSQSAQSVLPAVRQAPRSESQPTGKDRSGERPRLRQGDRFRRPAQGLSTGAIIGIAVAVAGVLGLLMMVGVVVILAGHRSTQSPTPVPSQNVVNGAPVGGKSYAVLLPGKDSRDVRQVFFTKGNRVTIRVTTTQWEGQFEPDVDLYVYDAQGNLVAEDTFDSKDCEVDFVPQRSENYRVELHLFEGARARCTVQY